MTGSMRHMYQLMGRDMSEELLLGLGAGVGFIYWQRTGQLPFLGGRANTGRPKEEGLEPLAGRRTGVVVTRHATSSARTAQSALVADLSVGTPAMLQVDMGLLPYFDFPVEYHFGGHVVAVVGYDEPGRTVLVCDRDTTLHPVSLESLAAARGSRFQPFPPKHASWTFDFTHQRAPRPDEVWEAISEGAKAMLEPPISNLGIRGIRKTAAMLPRWPSLLGVELLPDACFNSYLMIDAIGGTGGGLFRTMYAQFLDEAAAITGDPALPALAAEFRVAGDRWQEVADLFRTAHRSTDPAGPLSEIPRLLRSIADLEEAAWADLRALGRA
ncbi:BtrH N-terminal domain-containing protein [Pengzhenrongella frigida]|uniref:BtrH N-terminal domain-containing protein n=1 Tax=Pengzhenrongella frigida TaxID=1259133 RepID=UPI0013EBC46F|nr:BtrH N-terminal domain-containing protein [Cellulomonas sp. HLT2-17]